MPAPEKSKSLESWIWDAACSIRGAKDAAKYKDYTAPGIVLFLNRSKPKQWKGKIFLVNASQVFEKGDPKNFIPDAGIQRIADTLIGWKEEEKLSRIVDHAELKKNDYNISPSRYIHTSDAETRGSRQGRTCRPPQRGPAHPRSRLPRSLHPRFPRPQGPLPRKGPRRRHPARTRNLPPRARQRFRLPRPPDPHPDRLRRLLPRPPLLAPDYTAFLTEVKGRIQTARLQAGRAVNRELVMLYWDIGRGIVERQKVLGWGDAVVERFAGDLRAEFPDIQGFSPANVWRMRQCFEAYSGPEFLAQAVRELVAAVPWGHHVFLLGKIKEPQGMFYYLRATAQFGWSRSVLLNQIKGQAYERAVKEKKTHNFELALPEHFAEQADEMLKSR